MTPPEEKARQEGPQGVTDDRLHALIQADPGLSPDALAHKLDLPTQKVIHALLRLRQRRLIWCNEAGGWNPYAVY